MRLILSLSLPASLLLVAAAAAAPLTVGIHGGSSIPNLRDNGGNEISSGWSSRNAPFFGVSAELSAVGPWSLQAEVNFTGQGGKHDGLQPVTDPQLAQAAGGLPVYANFNNTAKLDYVEIPLLVKYHLPAPFHPSVAAGPYVGFLTSAKNVTSGSSRVYFRDRSGTILPMTDLSGNPVVADFTATTDVKSDLRAFNWGFQAGFGAALPYGRGAITLDVRAGLGLTNIQKDSANGKNSTGALTVALGYAFPVGL